MAGFWERELMARQQREQRVAEQQRAAEQRRFEEQRRRQQEEARRRAEERSRAADAARLRAQAEAQRRAEVEAGNRALAEARAAEARRAAMARQQTVPATSVAPVVQEAEQRSFWDRFSLPTGTPMVRPVPLEEQPSVEEFAAQMRPAGQLVSDVLFGPEVESVRPGTQQAGLLERFARTQAGEQEFRTAVERFGEGRPGSGLAWGLLGLAGAVPFFGDIAQGVAGVSRAAGAAGDVARGAGRAANVARGTDISQDIARDIIRNSTPNYTLPADRIASVPRGREVTAEIFHRQGFDALPIAVNRAQFNSLAKNTNDYIPLYRGIRGGRGSAGSVSTGRADEFVDAASAADEFVSGNLFYGGGAGPDGTYFATTPEVARNYAVGINSLMASSEPGAVISALLPRNARIVRYDDPQLLAEFAQSGYDNLGAFAAAKGYDAILHKDNIHIVLNRSALIVDDTPDIYRFGSPNPIPRRHPIR